METRMEIAAWAKVEELELVYRTKMRPLERPRITTAEDAWQIFLSVWETGRIDFQEEFKVMMLNSACKVLGIYSLSSGGIAGTVVDAKLVFCAALKAGATAIVLCHYAKHLVM
jgi:DNA repair protein RadC